MKNLLQSLKDDHGGFLHGSIAVLRRVLHEFHEGLIGSVPEVGLVPVGPVGGLQQHRHQHIKVGGEAVGAGLPVHALGICLLVGSLGKGAQGPAHVGSNTGLSLDK